MTVRADWFLDGIASAAADEPDPFAAPVEEVGRRFDLRDPKAALVLRLNELELREGRLFDEGITCTVKDRADTTCHACPISQAHDREAAHGALCRLGRAQEAAATELAVLTCRGE